MYCFKAELKKKKKKNFDILTRAHPAVQKIFHRIMEVHFAKCPIRPSEAKRERDKYPWINKNTKIAEEYFTQEIELVCT